LRRGEGVRGNCIGPNSEGLAMGENFEGNRRRKKTTKKNKNTFLCPGKGGEEKRGFSRGKEVERGKEKETPAPHRGGVW